MNNLVPCHNCGRTFARDRVQIHQNVCRPKTAGKGLPEPIAKAGQKQTQMGTAKIGGPISSRGQPSQVSISM